MHSFISAVNVVKCAIFLKLHVDRLNSGMSCCSYYNDKELKQSEAFSLLICLDDIKFVLLSLSTHIETI